MQVIAKLNLIAQRWALHDNTRSAAAIGFYAVFTLAPMLVFATTGLSQIVGQEKAQQLTEARLEVVIGPTGNAIARDIFTKTDFSQYGYTATVLSVVVVLYGSSSIFFQLRQALDRIFGRPDRSPRAAFFALILSRLIAALSVIVATLLLLATLIGQVVLGSLSEEFLAESQFADLSWNWLSTTSSISVAFFVVIVLLKFLPSQPPAWRHVFRGAIVCVVLFEIGKWLAGVYISKGLIASAYGPSSAIVAFILWIYFSAQIFILSAEVSQLSAESEA